MKTCKDITELIEKGKLEKISRKESFQIRIHLMMCSLCRKFYKDSDRLDQLLQMIKPSKFKLNKKEKDTIKKGLT